MTIVIDPSIATSSLLLLVATQNDLFFIGRGTGGGSDLPGGLILPASTFAHEF